MKSFSEISTSISIKKDQRNTYEYQAYGNRLAEEMAEPTKRSLYIRLAKINDRNLVEAARLFAISNPGNSKAKSFMWKLKELKNASINKEKEWAQFLNITDYRLLLAFL